MPQARQTVYAIGLMSGTSADGIDGVALRLADHNRPDIAASLSVGYPVAIHNRVREVTARKIRHPGQSAGLDLELTGLYADVANRLIRKIAPGKVAVIGCHGQTVHHSPHGNPPFSIQLADGAELARLTGHTTVTDFRSADMTMGGQGAPLACAFHQAVFAHRAEHRAIVNIGGISNVTWLPKDPNMPVTGFDTGPGNTFMDYWCRRHFNCDFDNNGAIARGGQIQPDLLALFLEDPYFAAPPPKSTGLEYFNENWLQAVLNVWKGAAGANHTDILATLTALTAHCITAQVNALKPPVDSVYLCGGGSRNALLVNRIKRLSTAKVESSLALGIAPQWVEAAAFAWMAWRTVNGLTSTLPSVTGASRPTVAGTLHIPPDTNRTIQSLPLED